MSDDRIDLDQARKRAKELLRAAKAGDSQARAQINRPDREPRLADAQRAIARELGFSSWTALAKAVTAAEQDALYHAAEQDSDADMRRLLRRAAVPVTGSRALHHSLDFDDIGKVRLLLDHGADPNELYPGDLTVRADTPLHHAVLRDRSVPFIELLIERGADPSAVDSHGLTPYALAIRLGRVAVAERLAHLGALTALTEHDRFVGACALGDDENAARLQPVSIDASDSFALITMAREGNTAAVITLARHGFSTTMTDTHMGGAALHHAAWYGHAETVAAVLSIGADPHATSEHGTPLDWCQHGRQVNSGDFERIEHLLRPDGRDFHDIGEDHDHTDAANAK